MAVPPSNINRADEDGVASMDDGLQRRMVGPTAFITGPRAPSPPHGLPS